MAHAGQIILLSIGLFEIGLFIIAWISSLYNHYKLYKLDSSCPNPKD